MSAEIERYHPPPTLAPVASFNATATFLQLDVDAGGSYDVDGSVASYSWEWGDGSPAGSGKTASHTYAQAGNYVVSLTVTDNQGALSPTTSRQVGVAARPNDPPVASFALFSNYLTASADASASKDEDGSLIGYSWTWGDGGTSSGAAPSHTYASSGTYEVRLTVTDNQGATATAARTLTVTAPPPPPPPSPSPTPAPSPPAPSPPPAPVTTSPGAGNEGNAPEIGSSPTFSWQPTSGATSYTLRISKYPYGSANIILMRAGISSTSITISTSELRAAAGNATSFRWGVTAVNTAGESPQSNVLYFRHSLPPPPQHPSEAPTARFTAATSGRNVTTDASASTDPNGRTLTYSWEWGDSTPNGTGRTATHTYAAPGSYTIRLTVTNDQGDTATATRDVLIPPPNQPPVAVLDVRADGLTVHASAEGSHDPDGDLAQLAWDWGDGSPLATGEEASHTYAAPGRYTVTLSVTDEDGVTVAASREVNATAPPPLSAPPARPAPTPASPPPTGATPPTPDQPQPTPTAPLPVVTDSPTSEPPPVTTPPSANSTTPNGTAPSVRSNVPSLGLLQLVGAGFVGALINDVRRRSRP